MGKFLLAVAVLTLYIYALLDLLRAPGQSVRILPKWLWALVIILIPVLGPASYVVLGRPRVDNPPSGGGDGGFGGGGGRGPRGPIAPDDDPEFLKRLDEASWSARMERLRRDRATGGTGSGGAPGGNGTVPPPSAPPDGQDSL